MPLDFSSPPIGFVFTLVTLVLLSLVWRLLGKPIRTVRATLHQAPSGTAGYLKTAGWYALRLGVLFIALFLLGEISGPWLWSALALLVFGWAPYLVEKSRLFQINAPNLILSVLGLILLLGGVHAFGKWLYRSAASGRGSPDAKPDRPWRARWTVGLVALFFLMIAASIGMIGAAHQTAWMLTSPTPFIIRPGLQHGFKAKTDLHNFYLSCKYFWLDHDPGRTCTEEIASRPDYGLVRTTRMELELYGGGTVDDFHAIASHDLSGDWYMVDPTGTLHVFSTDSP